MRTASQPHRSIPSALLLLLAACWQPVTAQDLLGDLFGRDPVAPATVRNPLANANDGVINPPDPNAPDIRVVGGPDHRAEPIPDRDLVPRNPGSAGGPGVVQLRPGLRADGLHQPLPRFDRSTREVIPGLRADPSSRVLFPGGMPAPAPAVPPPAAPAPAAPAPVAPAPGGPAPSGHRGGHHHDDVSAGDIINLIAGALNALGSSQQSGWQPSAGVSGWNRLTPAQQQRILGVLDDIENIDRRIDALRQHRAQLELQLRGMLAQAR